MAEIHRTTMTPTKLELLAPWLPGQRWYSGRGRLPRLSRVGGYRLDDPAGEVGIEFLVVAAESEGETTYYQVPLTYRGAPLAGAERALIGTSEHGVLGRRWIYDGAHDPVLAAQLLALVQGRAEPQAQGASNTPDPSVVGHASRPQVVTAVASRVLTGEQSNTSVIVDTVDADGRPAEPVIIKVFRALQDGDNPDVVVQSALSEAGSTQVPHSIGHVCGPWRTVDGGAAHGHLAFAQEFLPGVEDAWRVALAAVAAGQDFSDRARTLGRATAEVHATLTRALPTRPATPDDVAEAVTAMRSRHAAAASEAPGLAIHDRAVTAAFDAAAAAKWPLLQRIHGDYHLGQVLDVPGRGWVLLDFEGEPLRPLRERSRVDLALRDVAGMLRSFDYAAGSWEQAHPGHSAAAWAESARNAFLDGYAEASGRDPRDDLVLLRALELDKALYEVVYEARNRPTWLTIPTTAVARLVNHPKE